MRVLVLFAIVLFGGGTLEAAPAPSSPPAPSRSPMAATGVLFDFSKPVPEDFWQTLEEELHGTTATAWPERPLEWMKREEFHGGMEYPEIIQVRLEGHCKADLTTEWRHADGPLGWVYRIGGEIQPVVYVNCDRIGQTLERELQKTSPKERQRKFARAIARVVAHELGHIFRQSAEHSSHGLEKACLTAAELVKEGSL